MGLIPQTSPAGAAREPASTIPVVAREIDRAQRIVEGQNFDIRRTLWKYSALVDDQRRILYRWRHDLLHGEAEPGVWAEAGA